MRNLGKIKESGITLKILKSEIAKRKFHWRKVGLNHVFRVRSQLNIYTKIVLHMIWSDVIIF